MLVLVFAFPVVTLADFDFPLGYQSGRGYGSSQYLGGYEYLDNAETDTCKHFFHSGEDWNATQWGEDYGYDGNDAGDPVSAIGVGVIEQAEYVDSHSGYVVKIRHDGEFILPNKNQALDYYITSSTEKIQQVWSIYIHLASIGINPATSLVWRKGESIVGGQVLGYVGDFQHGSGNNFHLHFEIRKRNKAGDGRLCGLSREKVEQVYIKPSHFIQINRCKPESIPPPNYELPNECMGECCLYTPGSGFQWEALQDTPVFPRRDINSQPFTSILTGEKFTAETGVLVTKTPGFVKISFDLTRDCQSIGLEDGECVSVLAPWSEGYYHLWDQGRFVGGCFIGGADLEPDVYWWVYARRSNGQTGWILYRRGFDFCYSHPCYEERPECLD